MRRGKSLPGAASPATVLMITMAAKVANKILMAAEFSKLESENV
jgi:hypothetical protein